MKTKISILVALISLLPLYHISAQNISGHEIMQRVKDRPDGDTRQSQIVMKLINKHGSIRERKMDSYSIDFGTNKKDRKTIMFFRYPTDVSGTGFLTWDYDNPSKEDDRWLYLPAMKKTRRINGSSAKKDYFMGSDFTYDDMGSKSVDEDNHVLNGEEMIDGFKCWRVTSEPKDNREIYSSKISWIRQDCLMPVRIEFYDRSGKLHRLLEITNIKKVDGFWVGEKMTMMNVQTKHSTIIEIVNPKFNIPMKESGFVVSNLENGRL